MRLPLPPTLLLLAVAAAPAHAQLSATEAAAVDSIVVAQMQARGLVGLSLAIARDGRVVYQRAYGLAERIPARAADTTTRFAVGSVTKQFTAAVAVGLAHEGKLDLDAPVARWFPGVTRAGDIRVRDLFHHVAGYPDYYPLDFVDRRMARPVAAEQIIAQYATKPLDFEPGTRWSYSNTGFILLGAIAARAGGDAFGHLLEQRLFQPLGLTHTSYEPRIAGPRYARGYMTWALGDPEPARPEGRGWPGAAGAIWSTAGDLVRWDLALMQGRALPAAAWQEMRTPRTLTDGHSTNYAAGLAVIVRGADTIYQHGGAVGGFNATNLFIANRGYAVAALSNAENNIELGPIHRLLLPDLARPAPPPPADSGKPAPPATLQSPRGIPTVQGLPALEAARAFFGALQRGAVDRAGLGDEYSWFLTPARVRGAASRLGALGPVTDAQLLNLAERGGMEVAVVRFTTRDRMVDAVQYRSPDGKVQDFHLLQR